MKLCPLQEGRQCKPVCAWYVTTIYEEGCALEQIRGKLSQIAAVLGRWEEKEGACQ